MPSERDELAGKQVLVLGTGPGISGRRMMAGLAATREAGCRAVVVDTPDAPTAELASTFVAVDRISTEECLAALRGVVDPAELDGVVTFVEERTPVQAAVAAELGLLGHPVAAVELARDKAAMRRRMSELRLPSPVHLSLESERHAAAIADQMAYPAFLKIGDGGGSIGGRRIERADELAGAYRDLLGYVQDEVPANVRRSILRSFVDGRPNVLLESFLGPKPELAAEGLGRFTAELLLQGGHVRLCLVGDVELVSEQDPRVASVAFPSRLPPEDAKAVDALVRRVSTELGFRDGPLIVDGVVSTEGAQVYELNARIDAGVVLPTLDDAIGSSWVAQVLRSVTGVPLLEPEGSAHTAVELCLSSRAGTLERLEVPQRFASRTTVLKAIGDRVAGPEAAYDCVAIGRLVEPDAHRLLRERRAFREAVRWSTC